MPPQISFPAPDPSDEKFNGRPVLSASFKLTKIYVNSSPPLLAWFKSGPVQVAVRIVSRPVRPHGLATGLSRSFLEKGQYTSKVNTFKWAMNHYQ
jgi:hypothetical protein